MQCIDNYNNTVNHIWPHPCHNVNAWVQSNLVFPVVIVFVCEILTAPAAVICLASCNDYTNACQVHF